MIRRIGGPVAFLLIVVELLGFFVARRQSVANLEQEGTLLARYQAERIRSSLSYVETASKIICNSLETERGGQNKVLVDKLLRDVMTSHPEISGIEVHDLSSAERFTLHASQSGVLQPTTSSIAPESLPQRSRAEQEQGTWIIPRSNAQMESIYFIQHQGYLQVVFELPIRRLAKPFDLGDHESAYGFLATGVVVLFTNLSTPVTPDEDYTNFCNEVVLSNPDQSRFYRASDPINGEPAWVGTARVGDLDLVAGIVYPESAEFQPLHYVALSSVVEAGLALLLLGLGIRSIARSLSVPLETLSTKVSQAVQNDFIARVEPPSEASEEVTKLALSFNSMLDDLQRYLDEKEEAMSARQALESEINLAARIQSSMMPSFPFSLGELVSAGRSHAARTVGGDFLGAFRVGENRLGFCIGDVSGKGIPAAIYMAFASSLLQHLGKLGETPDFCLQVVNRALCEREEHSMFCTCFFGILSPDGTLHYCNAGHHAPILWSKEGKIEALREEGELALGIFPDTDYRCHSLQLQQGEQLFFYTDGVTEAMNCEHEEFGDDRLLESLKKFSRSRSPRENLELLIEDVDSFRNGCETNDDLTVLLVGWGIK